MRALPIIIVAAVVAVIVVLSSIFIVDERQQALVLQFGQVQREIRGTAATAPAPEGAEKMESTAEQSDDIEISTGPGLYFKLPLLQDVVYYEDRILPLETSELEVTPIDDRRLVVDAFARWRIEDPVQFRQAVQTEFAALPRLESILNAALREVLGSVPSDAVLSAERAALMRQIADTARDSSRNLGIEIVDVRIRRADLPQENLEATFRRMNAERQREAADERARGQERAQEVRATAQREAVELVSDAQRQSEEIRGRADAERNRIYASAFGQDPEFFAFYRSLRAYERSLKGENSTLVISPDSEFFEYLKNDGAAGADRIRRSNVAPFEPAEEETPEASGDGGTTGERGAGAAPSGEGGQPDESDGSQTDGPTGDQGARLETGDGTERVAADASTQEEAGVETEGAAQ